MLGKMDCSGCSHVGLRRSTNEDQFLIADLSKSMRVLQTSLGLDHQTRMFGTSQGKLLVVADGMGGHSAGERASQLAVDSVVTYILNTMQWFFRLDTKEDHDFREALQDALLSCQTAFEQEVEVIPQRQGMGTTLTMAYLLWPRLYIVHVGDSRCYLLRGGKLRQLTRDHTLRQLAKESERTAARENIEDDENGAGSNTLWNVISASEDGLAPEVCMSELQLGDALLLCTDGLYKHVATERLTELLQDERNCDDICRMMIEEANQDGGTDNITAIVARFCDDTGDACEQSAHVVDEVGDKTSGDDTGIYVSQTRPDEFDVVRK